MFDNSGQIASTIAIVVSLLSLGYSCYVLLNVWRRNKIGMSGLHVMPIRRSNFVLKLIAINQPEVQKLLADKSPHIYLEIVSTGKDKDFRHAALFSESDEGKVERVEFDLKKSPEYLPLILAMKNSRFLAGGVKKWRKKQPKHRNRETTQELTQTPNSAPR